MMNERIHRILTSQPDGVKATKDKNGVVTFVYRDDKFYKVENGQFVNEAHLQDYGGGLRHFKGADHYEGVL